MNEISLKEHIINRHVDLNLHTCFLDDEENVATFLLFNLSGQIVGYQQYRPDASKEKRNNPREGRYFTKIAAGHIGLFGLESVRDPYSTVFLTEGLFDAARLISKGCSAIAVLSNNPSPQVKSMLKTLPNKLVAICDNDIAGKKLASCADSSFFCVTGKDIGDSTDEEVNEIIKMVNKL